MLISNIGSEPSFSLSLVKVNEWCSLLMSCKILGHFCLSCFSYEYHPYT